jgi:hypothetical protein
MSFCAPIASGEALYGLGRSSIARTSDLLPKRLAPSKNGVAMHTMNRYFEFI